MSDRSAGGSDDDRVVMKEGRFGVEKPHVRVGFGTAVLEVPVRIRNPSTERRHDLRNLSDDGYLKPFLALYHHFTNRSEDIINVGSAPVLTFDRDRFEYREMDGQHVLVKRDAETKFEEMVLDGEHVEGGGP